MHAARFTGGARAQSHPIRTTVQVLAAAAIAIVPFAVAIPAAFAGTGFAVNPIFPRFDVNVGQIGIPAAIQVRNDSTSPENALGVTLNTINLVPACGTLHASKTGDCPSRSANPGVFQLSDTAVGETGTGCADRVFNVKLINPATGQVAFEADGPPVVLSAPGTPGSVCRIDFTLDVLKMPLNRLGKSLPTTFRTAQIGFAVGTSDVSGHRGAVAASSVAGVGLGMAPVFGPGVTVGQEGRPAFIQVTNFSTLFEDSGGVTLNAVKLVPACGTLHASKTGDCPSGSADPGVFQLSDTAVGESGTACAGRIFNVVVTHAATGQVAFEADGPPVVLSAPGTPGSICRIDFTLSVLKMPAKAVGRSASNTAATAQIAYAVGTSDVNGHRGAVTTSSVSVVGSAAL